MRAAFALISAGLLAFGATPAAAQPMETGIPRGDRDAATSIEHRGGTDPVVSGDVLRPASVPTPIAREGWVRDGALAVRGFAACLARHRTSGSRAFLAAEPYSAESIAAARRIAGRFSICLDFTDYPVGELRLQDQALRGALSEAMYLRDHPERPPVSITSAEPRPIGQDVFAARVDQATDPGQEVIRMFAECLADRQPTVVDTLLRSEFRSSAEGGLMAMLEPSMAPCLFEGQTVRLGPENLRFALADALYRKANQTAERDEFSGVSE